MNDMDNRRVHRTERKQIKKEYRTENSNVYQ
jgi:hypothetical protein